MAARCGGWTSEEVEAACRRADERRGPGGSVPAAPHDVWRSRVPIGYDGRSRFRATVDRIRKEVEFALDAERRQASAEAELAAEIVAQSAAPWSSLAVYP